MMLQRCCSLRANSAESRGTLTEKHFNQIYIQNLSNCNYFLFFRKDGKVQEGNLVIILPSTSSLSCWEGFAVQDNPCFCCWYTWCNKNSLVSASGKGHEYQKRTSIDKSAAKIRTKNMSLLLSGAEHMTTKNTEKAEIFNTFFIIIFFIKTGFQWSLVPETCGKVWTWKVLPFQ